MENVKLDISGMHCASCVATIEKSLKKIKGVENARVNLSTEKASVDFNPSVTRVRDIVENIIKRGFGAKARRAGLFFLAHLLLVFPVPVVQERPRFRCLKLRATRPAGKSATPA